MRLETFEAAVRQLNQIYGDRALPPERENIFWQEFKNVPDATFQKLVQTIIVEHMHFPPMSKWLGYLSGMPQQRLAAPEKFYPPCEACGTSGYVEAEAKDPKQGNCIFRCTCPAGEKMKIRNSQHFGPEHYAEFEIPKPDRGHERAGPNLDLDLARKWAAQYGQWKPGGLLPALPYDKTQRITDNIPAASAETKAKLEAPDDPSMIF